MKVTPFFSIGIPVYNAEKYLRECVDSILSQSFTDFELILVNDGSTDSSSRICDEYAQKDRRVKVFHYENGGISVASNHILENVSEGGTYIFLMDNDDVMCENALENAYKTIISNDYPDILRTNRLKTSYGKTIETVYDNPPDEWYNLTNDEKALYLITKSMMPFPTWVKFIKSTLISDNNINFEVKYSGVQDADFTLKVCREADTYAFGDFPAVNWFHPREGSVSSSYSLKTLLNATYMYYDYYNDLDNWDVQEELLKYTKQLFIANIRDYSAYSYNMSKADAKLYAETIEKVVGKNFKKLPQETGQKGLLFKLYNIIGIKNTILLFNSYLRLKGVIK